MSRQDLLAGLPSIKRSPTLCKWMELLDGDMTEDSALTEVMHAQLLKEYTSRSHTSVITPIMT
jgi:hypothetical protein